MANTHVLFTEMAEKCRSVLQDAESHPEFPEPLQPPHLLWMCDMVERNADVWSPSRINRWFGFIQAGLLAHGFLDLPELKIMFDEAKNAHGTEGDDVELTDHLSSASSFEFEIGGEH